MIALVTGATGFIGKALTALLASDRDSQVAILVRDTYRLHPLPPPLDALTDRLVVVYADLRDHDAVRRAVRAVRPQVIFHLAAGGAGEPFIDVDAALEQNLYGTLNLARCAFDETFAYPPQKLVVVRTPGELSAMNPYAASKAAAWQICAMYARTQQWPIVGAMPFQTYGPGQSSRTLVGGAMAAALAGEDFALTAGTQMRDWVYIRDVAEGLKAIGTAQIPPGTTVELGSGRLTSVAAVVRMVYDEVGGAGKPLIGALPSRVGEESLQVAQIVETKALIGWQASVSLESGLARYHDYLLKQKP